MKFFNASPDLSVFGKVKFKYADMQKKTYFFMRRRSLGKIDIPDKKRKYSIHSETYQYNLKS